MMRFTLPMVVLPLCLSVLSCVFTDRPLGEVYSNLSAEDWDGTWEFPSGHAEVSVLGDVRGGILLSVWYGDQIQLDNVQGFIMEGGDRHFLSFKVSSESEAWGWVMIAAEDDWGIVWFPNLPAVERLVKNGEIEGVIDGDNIGMMAVTKDFFTRLDASDDWGVIAWEAPLPLRRVQKNVRVESPSEL